MALTLGGIVSITTIQQRERTTVVTDEGALAPALTLTGLISRRSHSTLALARVAERHLHELAHWSRVAGGVHVDSTEMDVDDGLYELRNVQTRVTPETGVSIGVVVSLTLVRLGGAGAGGNVVRRILPQATLTANGFAVTSTPRFAQPVGANELTGGGVQVLTGSMGAQLVYGTATAQTYHLTTPDYNAGEVRLWDTGGSAVPADWTRVFGPDHQFAAATHCAIDNGLVRVTPAATAGVHAIEVWNGASWVAVTDASGDFVILNSAGFNAWLTCRIVDVTPWRVEVEWSMTRGAPPYFPKKTYVVERGKPLAKLTVTADIAATMWAGIIGPYTHSFAQGGTAAAAIGLIRDHTLAAEAGLADFAATGYLAQPYLAAATNLASVMALMAGATLSGYNWYKYSSGGIVIAATGAVTTYTAWLGGIAYNAAKIASEAEGGSRFGTAGIVTVAGASGGGSNNAITLPVVSDYVTLTAMQNPPVGSVVALYARVQNAGVSASDSVRIAIQNVTAGGVLTGSQQDWTAAALGSAGSWKWLSSVGTGWNGTDLINPLVLRVTAGGGGAIYVDKCVMVTVSNAGYLYAQDLGRAAMTEVRVRAQTIRQVR